ncbi:MAG: metallophosphoesterase family protein [Armatimonadota bacterium]|nr:MAG: metallophosphoesterase family protein [Armatimonadota bacterium]
MISRLLKTHLVFVAIALTAALASAAAAQQAGSIAIGPYVQNVSEDSATICWATIDGEATYAPAAGDAQTVRAYNHHSIWLRRLEPGTTYTYDVIGDGTDAGKGSFTTFPDGEHPFMFVAFGDTRSRHDVHRQIVERVIAEKPALVFNTGDLVSDGRDISHWEAFFEVSGHLMRSVPYYPALGNHENDARHYFDFFALPGNERYYSFNRGAVHFVVFDTAGLEIPETNQAVTEEQEKRFEQYLRAYYERQLEWLRDDLAGHADAKYVFAFFHHPLYSVRASRVEGAKEVREMFGSVFKDYNVSAVFTGHDHYYHRAVADGVQFVTTGGGGAPLYDTDAPQPESVKYAKIEHYVRVDVGPDKVAARVVDINGETIDEFEVAPRPAPAEPSGGEE